MRFLARERIFESTLRRPLIMGVLNVTPDSFYDGGRYSGRGAAVLRAREMLDEGADIIDVGGESTRPGSAGVSVEEEIGRVVPVIEDVVSRFGAAVSVDTSKPRVARAAVEAGAAIINDVTACGRSEGHIADVAASSGAGLVLMHMRGVPSDMQAGVIEYGDVVSEIKEYLVSRIKFAVSRGVSTENIVVDPGIGFGKTPAHNMEIIRRIGEFADIGRPVLVGASRKSFLGGIKGMKNPDERLFGTLAANLAAVSNGASIIRVHDVRAHSEFFRALAAIG